jgi:amino acid adenylation domain-containing protein
VNHHPPATDDPVTFSLTPIQEGLLAESLIASDPGLNVEQVVWELDHVPDLARLRAAWQGAVDAFDALRLGFDWPKSEKHPRQHVRAMEVPFHELDLSAPEESLRRSRLERFLDEDRSAGFDLLSGPLMRVSLLELGPQTAVCVWTIHHSIIDGGSYALVLQHVFESYVGGPRQRTPPSGRRPEFRDFLEWLSRLDRTPGIQHFASLLRGFDEPTPLPLQHDSRLTGQGKTKSTRMRLDRSATDMLRSVARETETTPNTLVQFAWAALLSAYSGETDIVFGATWSGRQSTIDGAAHVVGPLINTLPVRMDLASSTTVRSLLATLRSQHLAMRPFQQTALVDIKAKSAHRFRTIVVFDYESVQASLEKVDPRWKRHRVWSQSQAGHPLVLAARFDDAVLELELEFDVGLYAVADATRLLADYTRLLLGIGDQLDGSPFTLPMLDPELRRTLTTVEAAREIVPKHRSAIEQIMAQSKSAPGRVAVKELEGAGITYAELERRVLSLSSILRLHGVAPSVLVGVWLPRSIDGVVALLAVHAAGGAFVLLDPNDPEQRVEHMVHDSKAALLLVNGRTRGRLPDAGITEIDVDDPSVLEPPADPCEPSFPDLSSPAYVIYTSGSTGQPKGVCISHAALANHLAAITERFELKPSDRVLQFATPAFDVALEELLPTLAAGATVVLRNEDMIRSARVFFEAVAAEDISVINLPAAFWHQLVNAEYLTWPACLRIVGVGSERVSPESHRKFRESASGHMRFLNLYGPTEATITSTAYDDAEEDHGPSGIPIGRPLHGVSHFVLDDRKRVVPPGAVGQLYIGGAGLALGYLFREDLTAERFVPHPWQSGARLYATGDRVRKTAAGNYVYVDRVDNQVKVRGFRVELGEVEAQLRRHAAVSEAAVVLRKQSRAEGSLTAFVIADPELVSEDSLRDHLTASLPAHMVPSRIVVASSLPMSLSGKVDRRAIEALSIPESIKASPPLVRDDPSGLHRTLLGIWSEVLGEPVTSASSSFFELGGHSLLVVRMFSEVEQQLGKTCDVAAFFKNPTVASLAGLLRAAPNYGRTGLVQLTHGSPHVQPLFLAPGLTGRALDFIHLVDELTEEVPVYALELRAFRDAERPNETLSEAVTDVVDLMQRVQPRGPYAVAGYSAGGVFAVAIAEELRARSESTDFVALLDSVPPASVPIPSPFTSPERLLRLSKTVVGRVQEILSRSGAIPELLSRARAAARRGIARWNMFNVEYRPSIEELLGAIPVSFSKRDIDTMQRYLDAVVAHHFAETSIDLVLFRTPLDPPEGPFQHDLGWQLVTRGKVTIEQLSGRHGDVLTSSGCRELATLFNAHLKRRRRLSSVSPPAGS